MFVVFNPLRGHKCVTFDQVLVHICELVCMADYRFLMQEQKWCLTFDVLSLIWVSADITPSKVPATHSCFPESEDWAASPSWSSHIDPERAWRLHRKPRSLTIYKFEIKGCWGTERTYSWASGCDCVYGQLLKRAGRDKKSRRKERFERGCDTRYKVMVVVQGRADFRRIQSQHFRIKRRQDRGRVACGNTAV